MDLISLTIDGVQVEVAPGTTVLEAARQAAKLWNMGKVIHTAASE